MFIMQGPAGKRQQGADVIRYDDMRIDRLLIKGYQDQLEAELKGLGGLNDIEARLKGFEQEFAAYIGTRHAIAVNSGTDALQLALLGMGVGKGDSVIIPDVTYPAVALSVLYTGARPIIVDVGPDLQIDVKALGKKARKDTKAIIAVHMFARPCAIKPIMAFAQARGIKVIEDCCQAESSVLNGKRLGAFGDIACFSFSYYKPLSSCGGGGGVVCFNDPALKRIVNFTKMGGDHPELMEAGQRFARMSFLDLVMIKVKWRYLKEIIKTRAQIKAIYEKGLGGLEGVQIFQDPPGAVSVAQNFVICLERRDELGAALREGGVIWQQPYTPLSRMKIFKPFAQGAYPQSRRYYDHGLHLPLYSFMKKEEAGKIVDMVKVFVER
jgi:dTDP-4-amino-4,6-dideoxygalactose transaminase